MLKLLEPDKYYSRADYRLEQAEDQALLRFLHAEEASEREPFEF